MATAILSLIILLAYFGAATALGHLLSWVSSHYRRPGAR